MAITSEELLAKAFSKDDIDQLYDHEESCLPEFEKHLELYPNDYNFTVVSSDPGTGYGTLICLEEGCWCEIPLDPSFTEKSGGVHRGFGGLSAYWNPIRESATHVGARNARLGIQQSQEAAIDTKPALKAHSSGLSSEMDRLYASGSKPRSKSGSSASNGGGGAAAAAAAVVPKKRASLQGHSSAGLILSDDSDEDVKVDKKPRVDVKPDVHGVLADRGNAPRGASQSEPGQKSPQEQRLHSLEKKLAEWEALATELRLAAPDEREDDHYAQVDQANSKIAQYQAALVLWERENGPRPARSHAQAQADLQGHLQAHAQAQGAGGVGGAGGAGGAGGIAGGTGWHLDELARQRMQLEGAVGGVNPDDPMMGAILGFSGLGGGAVAGPSSDGAHDPYDAMAAAGAIGRTRPVHRTQEFEDFVQKAMEGESFEGNANVDAAAASLGLESQNELLPNMTIPLMPHQLIGVAWMKAQEESKHYGGILADEMGLGKTVESIALMLANESRDPDEKSTLIVAPLALLEQWKEEIEEKTADRYLSVLIYHGPERKKIKVKTLKKYDVVLTTYSTLVLDYPDDEGAQAKARKLAKKEGGDPEDFFEFQEKGPLLKMSWYRIILDEAQNIRNRQTKMSRAAAGVDALFRWCLTGTPVTNSLGDLFPLFRFIQLKPWYTWSEYRDHIMTHEKKRGDLAGKRAQAILRSCMLRRKKDSKLDGKELISLPKKHVELLSLEFTEEEREIYDSVEKKAQIKFKKMLRAGTVLKNYSHVLVMLLRLRQLCFHPCLIADHEATLEKKEATKEMVKTEIKRAQKELGPEFVRKMKAERLAAAVTRARSEQEESDESVSSDDCSICLDNVLTIEAGGAVTRCSHIFCRPCIVETINQPSVDDAGDEASAKCKPDQRPCPICRTPIGETDLYPLAAFEPSDESISEKLGVEMELDDDEDEGDDLDGFIVNDDEDEDEERPRSKKKAPKQPNRAVIQDSDDEEGDDALLASEAEEDNATESRKKDKGKGKAKKLTKAEASKLRKLQFSEQEPSRKMMWCLEELERLFKESPDDKVIIISSFTSMLDLLQDYLERNDIKSCRYQGDMSASERQQSLKVLKKSRKCKVMLLSLKCGGVGLTLTRANRVISLDLAWSYAVEAQAYDRTHRIGQRKEVFVKRLTIANTVEQRIAELQAKKQGLADASLGEGKAAKLGKLTVSEIGQLFGL